MPADEMIKYEGWQDQTLESMLATRLMQVALWPSDGRENARPNGHLGRSGVPRVRPRISWRLFTSIAIASVT